MDLLIALSLSVLTVPLVVATEGVPRIVLGLAFVLFVPGYVLVAALFPRKEGLDGVQRLALSLGLSISVVPLIGLVLNFTWGIRLYPMIVALLTFIVMMAAIAWYRRRYISPEQRFDVQLADVVCWLPRPWRTEKRWDRALTGVLILAIIGAVTMAGYAVANPKAGELFTEFYVLGPGGQADGYPERLLVGQKADLVVGIVNHEGRTVTYDVEVSVNGVTAQTVGPVTLNEGEKREEGVSLSSSVAGDGQEIRFTLHEESSAEPAEVLRLWVDVRAVT